MVYSRREGVVNLCEAILMLHPRLTNLQQVTLMAGSRKEGIVNLCGILTQHPHLTHMYLWVMLL